MLRTKVISSNLSSVGWEGNHCGEAGGEFNECRKEGCSTCNYLSGILEIEFKGSGIYRYLDVPKEIYDNLLKAESKGKYFFANVKKNYICEKRSHRYRSKKRERHKITLTDLGEAPGTLKNLYNEGKLTTDKGVKNLRAWAVKWVKYFQIDDGNRNVRENREYAIAVLKYLFNLEKKQTKL